MKHAANHRAWAIGTKQPNGFQVRRIVWGYLMAAYEKQKGEEIRAASIMVEAIPKKRSQPAGAAQ